MPKNTFSCYVKKHFAIMTFGLTAAGEIVETLAQAVGNVQSYQ